MIFMRDINKSSFSFKNLVNGGFIHLDEYYSLKYPGPKIAVDEFLSKVLKQKKQPNEFKRYYLTKAPS